MPRSISFTMPPPPPSRLVIALTLLALLPAGCTADHYKASADRQVYSILADRKQKTLGYQPEAIAPATVKPVDPPKRAYAAIPLTPRPPPQIPPMEPVQVLIPF